MNRRPFTPRQEFELAMGAGLALRDLSAPCVRGIRNHLPFDTPFNGDPSVRASGEPQGEVTACGLTRDALHKAIARVDADADADRCAHVRKGATPRGVMCRDCRREWVGEEGERVWKAMADFDADAAASDDGAAREPQDRLAAWLDHLAGVQANLPLVLTLDERVRLKLAAQLLREGLSDGR